MGVKVGGSEQRCKKQIAALKAAHKQVATEAHAVVSSLLGRHVQSKELKADALFKELSKGGAAISSASLCKFVKDLPDAKPNLVDIALERYSSGISELSFLAMAQDFYKCSREIALTAGASVKESKTLRKLTAGEIVEVTGASTTDEASGLTRFPCRVLEGNFDAWVTVQGNQGTSYLDKCPKPYLYSTEHNVTLES